MSKTKVIVTRKLPSAVEARLAELFDTQLNHDDHLFSRDELSKAMAEADVLVPTLNDQIDAELLDSAGSNLKLIANYGSGSDHIDVKAAHDRGIYVSTSPSTSASDTADMTIALILAVLRRFKEGSQVIESGKWSGWSPSSFLGTRVRGKTLGIMGLGRIGTALAEKAQVFGLEINYFDPTPAHPDKEARLNARRCDSLEELLPQIDILAVCAPLNEHTKAILNAERLALMKPTAFVINTARGRLIDEAALIDALANKTIAGAGLDVLAMGTHVNSDLCNMPNVMLLPHMGSATIEARTEMGETLILNVKMHEDGHKPPNLVIPD